MRYGCRGQGSIKGPSVITYTYVWIIKCVAKMITLLKFKTSSTENNQPNGTKESIFLPYA
jgi:hypothetical protein